MPGDIKPKAVVLHSGGLDSTTVLALAKRDGFEPCAMTFDYGQRHSCEITSARRSAEALGVVTRIEVVIDLRAIGGSALTADIDVPKDSGVIGKGIPVTYVPARNTIFLSYALAWAEVIGAHDIYIGVNALDYSGYPDCRPAFIEAYERLANLATRDGVEGRHITIHAPLIAMTKAEIVKTGASLDVDFGLTHSCYDPTPEGYACGRCDSCLIRIRAFSEAGILDPIRYTQRRRIVSM